MKHIVKLVIIILFMGCQNKIKPEVSNDNNLIQNKETKLDSVSEEDPSFEDVKADFSLMYNKKIKIDTCFNLNKKSIMHYEFEYYCLFDTLTIPSKYNWGNSPKDYIVHNFASRILLTHNGDTIVNTLIKKDDFKHLLDESLIKYGVLLYPIQNGLDKKNGIIQVQYSVSIPLTDVGKSVTLEIGLNGDILTLNAQ